MRCPSTATQPESTGIASPSDTFRAARNLAPGVLLAGTVAVAATFLSDHYGAPVMLLALLLGMAFNFLAIGSPCSAGIDFTAKRLLRIGVALLGVRITFAEIASLGFTPIVLICIFVALTIGGGVIIARLFGRDHLFGLLTGGAVAICGASAALAIAAVLPKLSERDTLFAVIAVTTLSTIAMIGYPILYTVLGFSDIETGVLIGATIHDVAQVIGAGYAVSDEAGIIATYVKLLRVSLLPLAILVIALTAGRGGGGRKTFPWFAVGFAVLLVANSLGWIPEDIRTVISAVSRWLLVAAISACARR